ncbi:MAG: hypothetical protein ABEI58_02870 [Candidatus Nanohaloarchaea archaeon]
MAEGLGDQEVVLESMAVNPFRDWSDWYGTDGEAVVTFETMQHHLWNAWRNQCVEIKKYDENGEEIRPEDFEKPKDYLEASDNAVESERIIEPQNFDYDEISGPGVYRDGTYYDEEDSVEEGYTIIVPHGFLTPELCGEYTEKLNQKFDRNFKLDIKEEQKPPISDLRRLKISFEREGKERFDQTDQEAKDELISSITGIIDGSSASVKDDCVSER